MHVQLSPVFHVHHPYGATRLGCVKARLGSVPPCICARPMMMPSPSVPPAPPVPDASHLPPGQKRGADDDDDDGDDGDENGNDPKEPKRVWVINVVPDCGCTCGDDMLS